MYYRKVYIIHSTLLSEKELKEPTRQEAKKSGAQHVGYVTCFSKILRCSEQFLESTRLLLATNLYMYMYIL